MYAIRSYYGPDYQIDAAGIGTDKTLRQWLQRCLDYAGSLPPKPARRRNKGKPS